MIVSTTMTLAATIAARSHQRALNMTPPSHARAGAGSGSPPAPGRSRVAPDPPERDAADDEPHDEPGHEHDRDEAEVPLAVLLHHLEVVGQEHGAHALRHPLEREDT